MWGCLFAERLDAVRFFLGSPMEWGNTGHLDRDHFDVKLRPKTSSWQSKSLQFIRMLKKGRYAGSLSMSGTRWNENTSSTSNILNVSRLMHCKWFRQLSFSKEYDMHRDRTSAPTKSWTWLTVHRRLKVELHLDNVYIVIALFLVHTHQWFCLGCRAVHPPRLLSNECRLWQSTQQVIVARRWLLFFTGASVSFR